MRRCMECIHRIPIEDYCIKHMTDITHVPGCDEFWPKDGIKPRCDKCRFSELNFNKEAICHRFDSQGPNGSIHAEDWFCDKWKSEI